MVGAEARKRLITLLDRCSDERHLRAAHALLLTHNLHRDVFALSRLILAVATSSPTTSALSYASLLFRHSPSPPNTFIHNTLIRAHARGPHPHLALRYFLLLLRSPPHSAPDHHSFPFALAACASIPSLQTGTQIHSTVFKNGLASADNYVQTAILRLYSPIPAVAHKLFDEIPIRDNVHWNVLMDSYISNHLPSNAIRLFDELLLSGNRPDAHVITTALTACSHAGALRKGAEIHSYLEERNKELIGDTFIGSALVSMYAKCGCIGEAVKVFDGMPERNTHVWSAMIGGLATHGFAGEAVRCLTRMREEDGLRPDGIVLLGVLAACAHGGLVDEGMRLLGDMAARYGVVPAHEHYSCAVDMLCRVGRLEDAVGLIRRMPMQPLASVWGSLLTGCKTYGNVELAEMAVGELQRMNKEGGDDEGVYVQLSNIYLNANKREDARRVRKLIGSRGMKKTPAVSAIEVDGVVSSFVAGDQVHPQRVEIFWAMDSLMDDMTNNSFVEIDLIIETIDEDYLLSGEL